MKRNLPFISLLSLLPLAASGMCAAETPQDSVPIPPPSDLPVSTGVNQGFSRAPKPVAWDKDSRTLTIEGISPTFAHSKQGNNSRFIIDQLRLSEDGSKLFIVSRTLFEGASDKGFKNVSIETLEAIAPHIFAGKGGTDPDGRSAQTLIIFEILPDGELAHCAQQEFDANGKPISTFEIYPNRGAGHIYGTTP